MSMYDFIRAGLLGIFVGAATRNFEWGLAAFVLGQILGVKK